MPRAPAQAKGWIPTTMTTTASLSRGVDASAGYPCPMAFMAPPRLADGSTDLPLRTHSHTNETQASSTHFPPTRSGGGVQQQQQLRKEKRQGRANPPVLVACPTEGWRMGIWMSTAAEENHHNGGAALNYHPQGQQQGPYQQQQPQQPQQQSQQQGGGGASEGGATTSTGHHHSHSHHHHPNSTASMLTRRPSRGDRSGAAGARKGESTRAADWLWENSHWTKLRANKERDRDVPKCRCVRTAYCVRLGFGWVGGTVCVDWLDG